ncbi:MAG: sensor histidine kinase [Dehalococcoidia bacterium]|nr:MAG: sensor histidine kinase [Dehalococcoidia bacterium]
MTGQTISFFVGLILGWFVLFLLILLYIGLRSWWLKRKFGLPIEHGLLLVEYGRRLTNADDQESLSRLLTRDVPAELGIQRASLLLTKDYQLIDIDNEDLILPVNHTVVRSVTASGEAQPSDRGRLRQLIDQGRTDLSWTRVWVPLLRGMNLNGMWLLGARDMGINCSPEDLRWLTSLSREAVAVLEVIRNNERERQAASEMRTLYRQVITAREDEHIRLSRELHDGVLQDLCAVSRDLKAMQANAEPDGGSYDHLVDLSAETVQSLRDICNDLRPPLLQQDLASALESLVEDMDSRSPAPVYIEINTEKELRFPDDVSLAIFRIIQEGLNNALQHADASEIAVRLTEYPDRLRFTITDDGQGIAGGIESASFVADAHYGIAGMRERAAMIGGKLELQSSVNYGTVVILELPIQYTS